MIRPAPQAIRPFRARFAAPSAATLSAAIALPLLIGVPALPALAAIIPIDTSLGAGTATRDTDGGLDWLDLTQSFGSLADTQARLAPGMDLNGWRLATQDEVRTFWSNAGIAPTSEAGSLVLTMDGAQVSATLTLFDLVGGTSFDGSIDTAFGYTAEEVSAASQSAAFLSRRFDGNNGFDASAAVLGASYSKTPSGGDAQAAWLVRDVPAVPAPGALGLLGLGLMVLALRRVRQR